MQARLGTIKLWRAILRAASSPIYANSRHRYGVASAGNHDALGVVCGRAEAGVAPLEGRVLEAGELEHETQLRLEVHGWRPRSRPAPPARPPFPPTIAPPGRDARSVPPAGRGQAL